MKIASAGYFAGRTVTRTAVNKTQAAGQKLTAENVIANIKPMRDKDGKDVYTLDEVRRYLTDILGYAGF